MESFDSRKPKRSLKSIFLLWFVLFSVIPLAFLTGIFLSRYSEAINDELKERLRGNIRELSAIFKEYENYLNKRGQFFANDTSLVYFMSTGDAKNSANTLKKGMRNPLPQQVSIFGRDGRHFATVFRDSKNRLQSSLRLEIALSDEIIQGLETKTQMSTISFLREEAFGRIQMIVITKALSKSGRIAGYIEQLINIDKVFLENLQKRLNLEFLLFDDKGKIIVSNNQDFELSPNDYFVERGISTDLDTFFELTLRDVPYGFITSPISWGQSRFLIGVGASKERAEKTIRDVNYAIIGVFFALIVLLIFTSFLTARVVLRPLYLLLEATQRMYQGNENIEIPITSETELGLLTESFNEMSRRVSSARSELENKVKEVEEAYDELKDTQSKLVHTAKMASLGQLVAGVAHELNNPIGFIFSNMSHLKDYSERLIKLIDAAENNPDQLEKIKEEEDYKYIVEDLPRLIKSCEDGARRTRDIVVGLRNFSRLEEAKLKKIDINEALENTLSLLRGETKNRIEVVKDYGELPQVLCYASQLNQVFMNILSNAAQAIEAKGKISIKTSVLDKKAKDKVVIEVGDSGKGISKDKLNQIFDPFFTTKGVGKGTGLGLSISYGIVEKHKGEIQVESEEGKGTKFTIVLPVEGPKFNP